MATTRPEWVGLFQQGRADAAAEAVYMSYRPAILDLCGKIANRHNLDDSAPLIAAVRLVLWERVEHLAEAWCQYQGGGFLAYLYQVMAPAAQLRAREERGICADQAGKSEIRTETERAIHRLIFGEDPGARIKDGWVIGRPALGAVGMVAIETDDAARALRQLRVDAKSASSLWEFDAGNISTAAEVLGARKAVLVQELSVLSARCMLDGIRAMTFAVWHRPGRAYRNSEVLVELPEGELAKIALDGLFGMIQGAQRANGRPRKHTAPHSRGRSGPGRKVARPTS